MTVVPANGIEFCVEERGSGDPIILLHGFTGSAASWWTIVDDLARDDRVVAIDLIGHGGTCAPVNPSRYAFGQALDDLAQVAAGLGIGRATWLGYSLGGRLALGMALRHRTLVSALVLESATPGIQDTTERAKRQDADEALARRITKSGVERFVDEWERRPMWDSQRALPEEIRLRLRGQRLRNRDIGLANSLLGMGQGAQPSFWDRLGEIDIPVLSIDGALDGKYVQIAARMHAAMPAASLVLVPDAGHMVHLERPDVFSDRVTEFIASSRSLTFDVQMQ